MLTQKNCDFSGYVTKNDLKCADGRTIRHNAFAADDGKEVPLVWMHQHDSPFNVLGKVRLENRKDGVFGYGSFNGTEEGQNAKHLVQHGDVLGLSIYANQLKQNGGDVLHGVIREVSLVMAGANPEAKINYVSLAHSEDGEDLDAIISLNFEEGLFHAAEEDDDKEESEMANKPDDKTIQDVINEMTEEQKQVMYFMVGKALEDAGAGDDDDDEEEPDVKHNVFEGDNAQNSLSHADYQAIFSDAKRCGSLKEAVENHMESGVLAHAVYNEDGTEQTYGVANINWLFPDMKTLNNTPEFIKRDTGWVSRVMNGVHHTPFSRIKSIFADITMDEARAKGYVKKGRKTEEVFGLLKRYTDPQTIYKKQKLDRDDIIDITDFDVVAWIKGEMRMMLDEEIARAILIGDGRSTSSPDKIYEAHVRPVITDDEEELFAIPVTVAPQASDALTAKATITAVLKSQRKYEGSGNTVFFAPPSVIDDMLLLEDTMEHRLYTDEQALARALRVSSIVSVPVMANVTDEDRGTLLGVIVDLKDYNVGADRGGAVNMFDDFDIDYNQQKYLIETRISGALIKPHSALVVWLKESENP